MGNRSRLSDAQRREAVELFQQGYAVALAAKKMGADRRWLKSLYGRWLVMAFCRLTIAARGRIPLRSNLRLFAVMLKGKLVMP